MRYRLPRALALAAVCACWRRLSARPPRSRCGTSTRRPSYEKAQFQQAVVSSEGVIRLGRRLRPFADLDASHVWDLVEVKDGMLFAAAGDEGKVYKIAADGKASVVYADEASRPFCLAPAGDDAVYVGAGPNGQILRVDAAGKVEDGLRHRRAVRLVAGRGRQDGDALRRHGAARPRLPDQPGGQGRRSSTPRSRTTSSAWRPVPTARSTPVWTRAVWFIALTRRARRSSCTRRPRRRCAASR